MKYDDKQIAVLESLVASLVFEVPYMREKLLDLRRVILPVTEEVADGAKRNLNFDVQIYTDKGAGVVKITAADDEQGASDGEVG